MKVRLNKYLSESGISSRRKADELIKFGKVLVNGQKADLGMTVDPEVDNITIGSKKISQDKSIYYALYKPRGVISTTSDEKNRKTVLDFIPDSTRVFPVGRLDSESEGLILLTNDGTLSNQLSHPRYEHEKEYLVEVTASNNFPKNLIKYRFEEGITIDRVKMKADKVWNLSKSTLNTEQVITFNVILHTGFNRQIRKMCGKMGLSVKKLVRTRVGKLNLSRLKLRPGQYQIITKNDII